MPDDDSRMHEVQRFRAAEKARRVHILTLITPLRATLDRFVLIEREGGGVLRLCSHARLSAPLRQGEDQPVSADEVAAFLRKVTLCEDAWAEDSFPEDVLDGVTIIVERAEANRYDITHMIAPRGSSPHGRLLGAWRLSFPAVDRALQKG